MTDPLFVIDCIKKKYEERSNANQFYLNIDYLIIPKGSVTIILGESGSGKSTLLNILGGLEKGDNGTQIDLYQDNSDAVSLSESIDYMEKSCSYIYQEKNLIRNASVLVNLGLSGNNKYKKEDICNALQAAGLGKKVNTTGLEYFLSQRISTLSGGEQQRVNIARAFLRNPKIIFADEPTSNLDSRNTLLVIRSLINWVQQDNERTVILITHDEELVSYADYLITLEDGKLLKSDFSPDRKKPSKKYSFELEKINQPDASNIEINNFSVVFLLAFQNMFYSKSYSFKNLLLSFQRYPSLIMLIVAIILQGIVFATKTHMDSFFDEALTNPRLMHVLVSENPMFPKQTKLSPQNIQDLSNKGYIGKYLGTDNIFPRKGRPESFVIKGDKQNKPHRFEMELLKISSNEPVLGTINILNADNENTQESLNNVLSFENIANPFGIVVEKRFFNGLKKKFGIKKDENVKIYLMGKGARRLKVTVLGLFTSSIPDREYSYKAVMSLKTYIEYCSQEFPSLIKQGKPKVYDRLSVYFDRSNYQNIFNILLGTNFEFSRDNFEKITKLLKVSEDTNKLLSVLLTGISSIVGLLIIIESWSVLRRMWGNILILFAQGVYRSKVFSVILIQMFFLIILAELISALFLWIIIKYLNYSNIIYLDIFQQSISHLFIVFMFISVFIISMVFFRARKRVKLASQIKQYS